jgi:hypothetical protein
MKHNHTTGPLLRATAVMALVGIIVSGVTFAALTSQQAVLAGNTIETATADLRVSKDGATYNDSLTGFDFANVVPGGSAVPAAGYGFYLKNFGATNLALKLAVTSVPTNPSNVDLSKVNVLLTTVGGAAPVQTFTLASLVSSAATGGVAVTNTLNAGIAQQYKFQVSMASDAFSGSSASLGNIDFAFSGSATN